METDADGSRILAGRLRILIEAAEWPLRAVTASFGIATLSRGTPDASTLIAEADHALYQSKRSGRNRITHHDDMDESLAELTSSRVSHPEPGCSG